MESPRSAIVYEDFLVFIGVGVGVASGVPVSDEAVALPSTPDCTEANVDEMSCPNETRGCATGCEMYPSGKGEIIDPAASTATGIHENNPIYQ
jgi:hypothetical protein